MVQNHRQSDFLRIWCIKQPTSARRVTPPWNVYMAKFDPSWEGNPVWQTGLPALARHPTYHVNVIKLNWEIILKCTLPHLRGLPHLPGVPHRRFVKPQESKDWLFSGTLIHWHNTFLFAVFTHVRKQKQKWKPFNTESPESGNWKKINIQKDLPRISSMQLYICEIFGKTFYPNLYSFCIETPCLCPFQGHFLWPPETNRNICF